MPTVQDFRGYISRTKLKAADQGASIAELSVEGILSCVPGSSRDDMPLCLEAMRAEAQVGDKTVKARYGNKKTNLTIAYQV